MIREDKRKKAEWTKKAVDIKNTEVGKFTHSYYDQAVFSEFPELIGGKVRLILTGSAPIARDVLSFL